MSRGITSTEQTELDKPGFNIVNLVKFEGIGGTDTYYTDGPVDIAALSQTYLSTNGLMGITDITEEEDIKIETVDITLSSVPTENVKLFLDYDYIDRRVLIHRAIVGDDYVVIGTPVLVFDGRLDQPRLVENFQNKTATLAVTATSHWADFESVSGRHTNPTEHKLLYTGDTFFDKATETQKDVKWGKE